MCYLDFRWLRTALWLVSKCGQMTWALKGWRRWRPLMAPLRRHVWLTVQVRFWSAHHPETSRWVKQVLDLSCNRGIMPSICPPTCPINQHLSRALKNFFLLFWPDCSFIYMLIYIQHTYINSIICTDVALKRDNSSRLTCLTHGLHAGVWATKLGEMAGVKVPLIAMHHAYVVTERIEGIQVGPAVGVDTTYLWDLSSVWSLILSSVFHQVKIHSLSATLTYSKTEVLHCSEVLSWTEVKRSSMLVPF